MSSGASCPTRPSRASSYCKKRSTKHSGLIGKTSLVCRGSQVSPGGWRPSIRYDINNPDRYDMHDERKAKAFRSSWQVDNSASHQALDELDCDCGCAVLDVQDGVHFDHVERRNYPGLVDQLHQQVRLPVGESAAHGCAYAGGDFGIDGVEGEREVNPVDIREAFDGASHDARRAVGVDVLHSVDPHAGLPQQPLLLNIHGAQPDDHDVLCPDAGPRTADPDEVRVAAPR